MGRLCKVAARAGRPYHSDTCNLVSLLGRMGIAGIQQSLLCLQDSDCYPPVILYQACMARFQQWGDYKKLLEAPPMSDKAKDGPAAGHG